MHMGLGRGNQINSQTRLSHRCVQVRIDDRAMAPTQTLEHTVIIEARLGRIEPG